MKKTLIALAMVMASGSAMATDITSAPHVGSFSATFEVAKSCVITTLPTAATDIAFNDADITDTDAKLIIAANTTEAPTVEFGAITSSLKLAGTDTSATADLSVKFGALGDKSGDTASSIVKSSGTYTLSNIGFSASGLETAYHAGSNQSASVVMTVTCPDA